MISPQRRREIIDALRRGTVPPRGLDALAVGLDQLGPVIEDELRGVAAGGAVAKALRGEWGSGKTFASRWVAERARRMGFASSEVQISEGETPLHHLETVYRRLCERLSTADVQGGALRSVVDAWFFALEEEVLAAGDVREDDPAGLLAATDALAERRLSEVIRRAPAFGAVLRGYRRALVEGDTTAAEGLIAWLGGQPHVAAGVKRSAGIKGDLDHDAALSFLEGLLRVLRDAGHAGLVLILDEVETLQRVRGDVRDRALNALRQLFDEIDAGRFPGLYLLITGTPAFFDGPQGAKRLPPLAQRLHTDFTTDARYDNQRAVQVRLPGFDRARLSEVGRRVRDLYADGAPGGPDAESRIRLHVGDDYIALLADAVTGELGGRVGVTPRVYLKKLVGDVLDRVDQFPDFDPRRDYKLTLVDSELTEVERNARAAVSVNDIDLDL
ncbi:MAG: BREX system ATP-binding protein BrxD [Actinomycetota bacterium]